MIQSNVTSVWTISTDNNGDGNYIQNYDSSVTIVEFLKMVLRLKLISNKVIKNVNIKCESITNPQMNAIRRFLRKTKAKTMWDELLKELNYKSGKNSIELSSDLRFIEINNDTPEIHEIINIINHLKSNRMNISNKINIPSSFARDKDGVVYLIDPTIIQHGNINKEIPNEFIIKFPNIEMSYNNDFLDILGKTLFGELINKGIIEKSEDEGLQPPKKKQRVTKDYDENDLKKIFESLESLSDIMKLPDDCSNKIIQKLCDLKEPIDNLQKMFGMEEIKTQIFDIIIYYAQKEKIQKHQRLHTVIYGKPGTGKTTFAKIYSEILCNLGVLKKDHVHFVKSHDLIAEYGSVSVYGD